jgi:hypothetical protein
LRVRLSFNSSVLFVFVSGSSGLLKQEKGWRRFYDRGRFRRRLSGSAAASRKGEKKGAVARRIPRVMSPGRGRGPAEKDRPIDPTSGKKFARKRARSGFEPWQADGRQPFVPEDYLTTPAFESYPFGFADCEADAAAFRRA